MLGIEFSLLKIDIVGSQPLYDSTVRNKLLEELLKHPKFVPEQWGYSERGGNKFDADKVLAHDAGDASQETLQFRRRRGVRYDMRMHLGRRPNLVWVFEPPPPKETWQELFTIAEGFANAYEPDVLWVMARTSMKFNFDDADSRTQTLMARGTGGAPVHYRDHGVGSLGIRTVFGPQLVEQIGARLLGSLPSPAVVKDLKWGGMLIDLVPEPWSKQMAEVRESWVTCMKHLEPNTFMTRLELLPSGAVRRTLPQTPGWDPGGLVL
jgi:hypothetical protein